MTVATAADALRRRFDQAPMSPAQKRVVALTVLLSALDGYDVLSVTFAAPAISQAWHTGKVALGAVLASGLVGMAVGSFVLAPLADVVGRRKMVLASLMLMALGSLLSAFAHATPQLSAYRVVTGLGIGTCIAVINPIAAEFANARYRPLALSLMAMGYPAGGLVGALLAALLLRLSTWPAVFAAGALIALAIIPVALLILSESLSYLVSRPGPNQLSRLNALLARCNQPTVTALIPPDHRRRGYAGIFAPGQVMTTFILTIVNLLTASVVYFVLSWLPQMVSDEGFGPSKASLVAAILNLVGIVGGLTLGWLARRGGLRRMTVAAVAGFGLAVIALGSTPPSLPLLIGTAAICGFFLFAGVAGFYATLAQSFADEARASGTGFVIGVGRVTSAAAPLIAGYLFSAGLDRATVSGLFGAGALAAAALLATLNTRRGGGT